MTGAGALAAILAAGLGAGQAGAATTAQYLWVASYGPPATAGAGGVTSYPTSSASGAQATTTISSPGDGPTSEVLDTSGDLWVADMGAGTVVEYTPGADGAFSATPAVTLGGFQQPDGLAFDAAGDLWVSNYGDTGSNGSVVEIAHGALSASGTPVPTTTITGGVNGPTGLGFDDPGNLWVANDPADYDAGQGGINFDLAEYGYDSSASTYALTPTATIDAFTETPSYNPQQPYDDIDYPQGMTFSQGNLWLADQGNGQIVEFAKAQLASPRPNTEPALSIGNTCYTYPATNATACNQQSLNAPEGIAFDSAGNMWVSNDGNSNSSTNNGNPNYSLVEFSAADVATTGAPLPETTIVAGLSAPADVVIQTVTSSPSTGNNNPPSSNPPSSNPPSSSSGSGQPSAPVIPSGSISTLSPPSSPAPAASTPPAPAPAQSAPTAPAPQAVVPLARLSAGNGAAKLAHGSVQIRLSCLAGASCAATGSMSVVRRVHGHLAHLVLARARFALDEGQSKLVGFRLTKAGRSALAHLGAHKHYRMTLVAMVAGGARLVHAVLIR